MTLPTPREARPFFREVMVERLLPEFDAEVSRVSYGDGCKVFFADGSFVCCRFSGTEPLLRIVAEASSWKQAADSVERFKRMLGF